MERIEQKEEKNEPVISEKLPPKIRELLKKRGWSWPPDEKLKKQIEEAMERFGRSIHLDPEVVKEMHKDKEENLYWR